MALSIPITPSAQWLRERKERTARLNKQLRRRFSALWRERLGGCSFLPNDEEGRMMLMVLLRVGTTTESAMENAPWLTEREFKALRKAARKIPWKQIGELIKLTYAERMAHKLYYWLPIDMSPEEARRRQEQRDRENDRKRKAKTRAENKELRDMLSKSNDRKDAIKRMLAGLDAPPSRQGCMPPGPCPPSGSGWVASPVMVKRAKTVDAFRRPDGRPLRNPRDAVHCALEQLEADGEIEIGMGVGKRGPVVFARLRGGQADVFCDRRSVGGVVEVESVDTSTGSTENQASETVSGLVSTEQDPDKRCSEAHQKAPTSGPLAFARGMSSRASGNKAKGVAAKKETRVADEHLSRDDIPPHAPPGERLH
jgi:hypothetical protein